MIKAVLFDMDDTLIHLDVPWEKVGGEIGRYLSEHGCVYNGDIPTTIANEKNQKLKKGLTKIIESYEGRGWQNSVLLPNTKNMLEWLKGKYPLGLITGNGAYVVKKAMAKFNLGGYFKVVMTREDGMKPLPDPILKAIALLGVGADKAILVGNGLADMKAAKAAGVKAVGLTTTRTSEELKNAGADIVISSLTELKKVLE